MIKWLINRKKAKIEEQKQIEERRREMQEKIERHEELEKQKKEKLIEEIKKNELRNRLNSVLRRRIKELRLQAITVQDNRVRDSILNNFELMKMPLYAFVTSVGEIIEQNRREENEYLVCNISEDEFAELFRSIYEIIDKNKDICFTDQIFKSGEIHNMFEEYADMCGYSMTRMKYSSLLKKSVLCNYVEENVKKIQQNIHPYISEMFIGFKHSSFGGRDIDELSLEIEKIKKGVWYWHGYREGEFNILHPEGKLGKLFVCLISLAMYIKIIEVAELVSCNEELMKIFGDRQVDPDEIYDIYENLYTHTIEYKFDTKYLRLLIAVLRINDVYKENYKPNAYELLNTIEISTDLDTKNIYNIMQDKLLEENFIQKIYENSISEDLIIALPKWMLSKIGINEWLRNTSDYCSLIEKIKAHLKRYEILKSTIKNNDIKEEGEEECTLVYSNDQQLSLVEQFNTIVTGREFEEFLETLYKELGYIVTLTPESNDQGADLVIEKNNIKTVVQAKFYSNSVGNSSVQQVVGAIKYYNADQGMVVTNSVFTRSARELAKANGIKLVSGEALENILENFLG